MVPGLTSPMPLITRLPAILQEDEFLQRMLPAFDDAVAPVYSALDNLAAYVSPAYAPSDFVDWLAGWVDIAVDEEWPEAQRRRIIADAAALHRRAGTVSGIRDALQLAAGPDAVVEVAESGGVSWSATPGGGLPGSADAVVHLSVAVPEGDEASLRRRLERVAAGVVPAHLPMELSVRVQAAGS